MDSDPRPHDRGERRAVAMRLRARQPAPAAHPVSSARRRGRAHVSLHDASLTINMKTVHVRPHTSASEGRTESSSRSRTCSPRSVRCTAFASSGMYERVRHVKCCTQLMRAVANARSAHTRFISGLRAARRSARAWRTARSCRRSRMCDGAVWWARSARTDAWACVRWLGWVAQLAEQRPRRQGRQGGRCEPGALHGTPDAQVRVAALSGGRVRRGLRRVTGGACAKALISRRLQVNNLGLEGARAIAVALSFCPALKSLEYVRPCRSSSLRSG